MRLDGWGKELAFPSPGAAVAPCSPRTISGGDVPAQRSAPLEKLQPASTLPVSCKSLYTDTHMYRYLISITGKTGQSLKPQYVNTLYKQEAALQQQVIKKDCSPTKNRESHLKNEGEQEESHLFHSGWRILNLT